jgi:hypothetical protein
MHARPWQLKHAQIYLQRFPVSFGLDFTCTSCPGYLSFTTCIHVGPTPHRRRVIQFAAYVSPSQRVL